MKKIRLEINALRVESFEPGTAEPTLKGTVHANVFNRDIPNDPTNALACASEWGCGGGTNGCVEVTGGCYYEITPLCPTGSDVC